MRKHALAIHRNPLMGDGGIRKATSGIESVGEIIFIDWFSVMLCSLGIPNFEKN